MRIANKNDFIKGVVGWVDLLSPNIDETLSGYTNQKKLVGVRHVVHDEADDNFMLQPAFQDGIAALKEFNLTYDLLLFPKHLPVARFVHPDDFKKYKDYALNKGFRFVESGPLVRSSYHAEKHIF